MTRFDVWRRRSTPNWMPGLRAGLSFMWSQPPLHLSHTGPAPAGPIVAAMRERRKQLPFVLSGKKGPKSSCFRVGIAARIRAFG